MEHLRVMETSKPQLHYSVYYYKSPHCIFQMGRFYCMQVIGKLLEHNIGLTSTISKHCHIMLLLTILCKNEYLKINYVTSGSYPETPLTVYLCNLTQESCFHSLPQVLTLGSLFVDK